MKVCICGWYGTETLGDRAILTGIIKILHDTFHDFEVAIGSLYPFLTRRTLLEDGDIYAGIAPGTSVGCFGVRDKTALDEMIDQSDMIIFGGGPIMDLAELEIMRYLFVQAKKEKKKTLILGCGIGPLYKKQFRKAASDILKHADLIIFRDAYSVLSAYEICPEQVERFAYFHDPAILAVGEYLSGNVSKKEPGKLIVNLRQFHDIGFGKKDYLDDSKLIGFLDLLSDCFEKVELVPMHTFGTGGDDRLYLTKLKSSLSKDNIEVIHKPQNLFQLFELFANSEACVGMRYHSIVFQTLLNGNNYILDYTDKERGKINAFLSMIDPKSFYQDRYCNVQEDFNEIRFQEIPGILRGKAAFIYDNRIFQETLQDYCERIREIFC